MLDVCCCHQNAFLYLTGWPDHELLCCRCENRNTVISAGAGKETECSPPTTSRVRFATKEHGSVVAHVHTFSRHPSQRDKDLYWTKNEKTMFVKRAHRQSRDLRTIDSACSKRMESAFHSSKYVDSPEGKDDVISSWVNSDNRGLEHGALRGLRIAQRLIVKQTVEYHKSLSNTSNTRTGDVEHILREYYKERTTQARDFAVRVAIADELAVL